MVKLKISKTEVLIKNFGYLLALVFFISCSTNKNTFLHREYNAMTSEYNILYNGNLAFEKGLQEINDKYVDDYWNDLLIEPLEINPNFINLSVLSNNKNSKTETKKDATLFDVAEEKAVKAIQKHSMLIAGVERNRKIDDAFLLLGKSRYYTQRFVPALEALNYIVKNYPEANLMDETLLWKAKTNIRLQNEELAIDILEKLVSKEKVSKTIIEDAYITTALAYKQLDSIEGVVDHLKKAVSASKNPQKKARNLMILGQIYRNEGLVDLSQQSFQKIIASKKSPYKYKLHAELEQFKNYKKGSDVSPMLAHLSKLIKNRDNRPYLDELYYHKAILEGNQGNSEKQIENYQKSIHAKNAGSYQKGLSYEGLGNYYFAETNYKKAGAYYDSVLQVSGKINSKRIRSIHKKSKSLETVLLFENLIKRNDSIWNVLSMNVDDQKKYYQKHIDERIAKEDSIAKASKKEALLAAYKNADAGGGFQPTPTFGVKDGKWYFYNDQTINFGKQEFKRVWGNRKLTDKWRWSTGIQTENETVANETDLVVENAVELGADDPNSVAYYIKQLPSKESDLDSISKLRSVTYYQLGLIYKEQFKENKLAAKTLENLLEIFPEEKLVLGTNYHLYKIYKELNDPKAEAYRNVVITQYPNSTFAQMLQNPDEENTLANGETAESKYKEMYNLYKLEKYVETIYGISNALRQFEGSPLVPKYELLKAYALMKVEGKEAFKKALEFIVLNYANTEEAKKASEFINKIK